MLKLAEFGEFRQHHDNKYEKFEDEMKFDRYRTPENAISGLISVSQDVWVSGCLMVEVFSKPVWSEYEYENKMLDDLKKYYVPKINKDIPKQMWGLICECLNPFIETRINSQEALERYVRLMLKMGIPEIMKEIGRIV
jgi:hypothetical protein